MTILWISNNQMGAEQQKALNKKFPHGLSFIYLSCRSYTNIDYIDRCINESDIIAIGDKMLEESFFKLSNGKPVIRPVYEKALDHDMVINRFVKWEQLIDIVVKDF